MKKHFLLKLTLSILFTIFCIITLNSCNKYTEYQEAKKRLEMEKQAKKQKKQKQDDKETQKMINELSYRKEATLIAIKYKTNEENVFNFLAEFENLNLENIRASMESKFITKNRLNSLAQKYNIPIEILASMLIDYYSMSKSEY